MAAVPKPHDHDEQHVIVHGVDDAVLPHPNAKTGPSLQSLRARGARVLRQQGDGALHAVPNLRVELAQGSGRGGA